ncbi:hypothetical protein AB1K32_23740 [Metabacillus dongyingensis]|uniref:hypothetical protein n=1 Tax=Metabacillus dongyingensis TaxID=2874282 RepID=UPI003B8C7E1C
MELDITKNRQSRTDSGRQIRVNLFWPRSWAVELDNIECGIDWQGPKLNAYPPIIEI